MVDKAIITQDNELRILIFTAAYFVLDGVTLTIRRLENHLRSKGAVVKICTCVSDEMDGDLITDVIVVPGIKIPFAQAGTGRTKICPFMIIFFFHRLLDWSRLGCGYDTAN